MSKDLAGLLRRGRAGHAEFRRPAAEAIDGLTRLAGDPKTDAPEEAARNSFFADAPQLPVESANEQLEPSPLPPGTWEATPGDLEALGELAFKDGSTLAARARALADAALESSTNILKLHEAVLAALAYVKYVADTFLADMPGTPLTMEVQALASVADTPNPPALSVPEMVLEHHPAAFSAAQLAATEAQKVVNLVNLAVDPALEGVYLGLAAEHFSSLEQLAGDAAEAEAKARAAAQPALSADQAVRDLFFEWFLSTNPPSVTVADVTAAMHAVAKEVAAWIDMAFRFTVHPALVKYMAEANVGSPDQVLAPAPVDSFDQDSLLGKPGYEFWIAFSQVASSDGPGLPQSAGSDGSGDAPDFAAETNGIATFDHFLHRSNAQPSGQPTGKHIIDLLEDLETKGSQLVIKTPNPIKLVEHRERIYPVLRAWDKALAQYEAELVGLETLTWPESSAMYIGEDVSKTG